MLLEQEVKKRIQLAIDNAVEEIKKIIKQ